MYRIYLSKADVFWNDEQETNYPNWDIDDSYFNYQINTQIGINFRTWDTGDIVVEENDITHIRVTYWKERPQADPIRMHSTYWIVSSVQKILDKGYVLNLKLDIYMTYLRKILSFLARTNKKVYLERLSLTTRLLKNTNYNSFFARIARLEDELVDGIKPVFKSIDVRKSSKYDNNRLLAFHDGGEHDVVKSANNPSIKSDIIYDLGVYAVFAPQNNKDHGYKVASYHCYPIYTEINSAYTLELKVSGKTIRLANNLRDISKYLINITTDTYGAKGYVGTYIMPHPFPQVDYHTSKVTLDKDNYTYFLFYKVDAVRSSDFTCEYGYPSSGLNDDIHTFFACMHNEVQVGLTRKKYKEIYAIKPQDSSSPFTIKYQLMFTDGFVGVPNEPNAVNLDESDMISFGNQLPSETQGYLETIRAAKQNYDMGLSSLAVGGVKQFIGAGGSAIQGASQGALAGGPVGAVAGGVSAAGMSMFNLVTDSVWGAIKLNRDYNYAKAGAQRTYINAYTKDIYNFIFYKAMFFSSPASNYSSRFNVGIALIHYELTDEHKELYKQMYQQFGFPIKGFVDFKEMVDQNQYDRICYIKFNHGWLMSSLSELLMYSGNAGVNQVEKEVIGAFLANGLRIRMNNGIF